MHSRLSLIVLAGLLPPVGPAPAPAQPAAIPVAIPAEERVWEAPLGRLRDARLVGVGLVGDLLLVEDDAHGLSALDPATGRLSWFVGLPGALDQWPAAGDGALALAAGSELLVVSSRTGQRLCQLDSPPLAAASPVSDDRMAYVPSLLGNRLVALDLDSGRTAWEFPMRGSSIGPPLLVGDGARRSVLVACDDGVLRAVPAGPAVPATERWVLRTGRVLGAMVSDGRRVYLSSAERTVTALDAGTGVVAWKFHSGEPLAGKPVLAGAAVCVGTASRLVALEAATGALRWERAQADIPLGATAAAVLVARGASTALVSSADGRDLADDLPRDVLVAGDLLIELEGDGSSLVARGILSR